MSTPVPRNCLASSRRLLPLLTLGVSLLCHPVPSGAAEPTIAGLTASKLDSALKGQVLIEELNCVACHAGEAALKASSKQAPRLAEIGSRVNPGYLEKFISDPHGTKPGTTMPDLMGGVAVAEKQLVATSLTHFLLSLKKQDFNPQAPDAVAAAQGKLLFHSRGCAACHSPRDEKGTELPVANSVPLGALDKKYSFKSLTQFLQQPHLSRPSGRMPDMKLQGKDIERIAHFLLQSTKVPARWLTLYIAAKSGKDSRATKLRRNARGRWQISLRRALVRSSIRRPSPMKAG